VATTNAVLNTIQRLRPDIEVIVRVQYFQELEKLHLGPGVRPVVAELEITLELVSKTLHLYGVTAENVQQFSAETREQIIESRGVMI
jgi:hypothetical protein